MKFALISVSDKEGVERVVEKLVEEGFQILATAGTAEYLRKAGFDVTGISEMTGMVERRELKTLHPAIVEMIYSGKIGVVVVNLYPFPATRRLDDIDIGGVTMLRVAAKNYEKVAPIPSTDCYRYIPDAIYSIELRRELAARTFRMTADYDAAISEWLSTRECDG